MGCGSTGCGAAVVPTAAADGVGVGLEGQPEVGHVGSTGAFGVRVSIDNGQLLETSSLHFMKNLGGFHTPPGAVSPWPRGLDDVVVRAGLERATVPSRPQPDMKITGRSGSPGAVSISHDVVGTRQDQVEGGPGRAYRSR